MPSLGDSAVIIFLGLLLFGPKGLAQIARQLGKLMGEFRRASNEFRMQMEEELRVAEQADRQKEIAKIEAAAPAPPVLTSSVAECPEDSAKLRASSADMALDPLEEPIGEVVPVPIATSGELRIMPPASGLPAPRSSAIAPLFESVPHMDAPNGHVEVALSGGSEDKPMRYTNHHEENGGGAAPVPEAGPELSQELSPDAVEATESVHG
jgi:sec-independent protein translocase protein TatB